MESNSVCLELSNLTSDENHVLTEDFQYLDGSLVASGRPVSDCLPQADAIEAVSALKAACERLGHDLAGRLRATWVRAPAL